MSSTSPQRRSALPRFAEVALDRARLSVVPRLRTRAPRIPFVTLVSVILLAGVVGLLLFNTSMQQASFTASELEDQSANLSARQQELAMQLDGLRDPKRLAEAACELGMVVPPTVAFIDLATGKRTGTASKAEASSAPCTAPVRFKAPAPTAGGDRTDVTSGGGPGAGAAGSGTGAANTRDTTGTTGTTSTGAPSGQRLRTNR